MKNKKRNNINRNQQGEFTSASSSQGKFQKFVKEYGTTNNILKGVGILSALGVAGYAAFRYIPFERIIDSIEEKFNDTFKGEETVNSNGVYTPEHQY